MLLFQRNVVHASRFSAQLGDGSMASKELLGVDTRSWIGDENGRVHARAGIARGLGVVLEKKKLKKVNMLWNCLCFLLQGISLKYSVIKTVLLEKLNDNLAFSWSSKECEMLITNLTMELFYLGFSGNLNISTRALQAKSTKQIWFPSWDRIKVIDPNVWKRVYTFHLQLYKASSGGVTKASDTRFPSHQRPICSQEKGKVRAR